MPIKVTKKCTRCRREEEFSAENAAAAADMEAKTARQLEAANKLAALVDELSDDLPPFIAIMAVDNGARSIVHSHLCNDPDAKRSCTKRVTALMDQLSALPEPKERKGKVKPIPLTEVAP